MPEYLSPGVYVEEVSFRSKSIEGVPTSTAGFAGMTRTGPVFYNHAAPGENGLGPAPCEPRLITSWTEFERVYGGLDPLRVGSSNDERLPYLAHAVRAFFDNGGQRVYISRVWIPRDKDLTWDGVARLNVDVGSASTIHWRARWPGAAGNVTIRTRVRRSRNLVYLDSDGNRRLRQVKTGSVVEYIAAGSDVPARDAPVTLANLHVIEVNEDGDQILHNQTAGTTTLNSGDVVQLIELDVSVTGENDRSENYDQLSTSAEQTRSIHRILAKDEPEREDASVWFELTTLDPADAGLLWPSKLMWALIDHGSGRLIDGHDGELALPDDLEGNEADPDIAEIKATGLAALGEIDDIAIVALPDGSTYDNFDTCVQAMDRLITHAEDLRYRIALVDPPEASSLNRVRDFRGRFDSKYAALYHPWCEILDPTQRPAQGAPPQRLRLPPSGFVAGIYARNDIERGVHKAPANEIVRGITRFDANITKGRQDVLNPEGINALRTFEGRGNRVWGARTLSSDPEWKYVNVRRLFIYIEHSIDKGTQWAVFEPNGPRLWDNIRRTIQDFLLVL
ncbi:MAG TPA: phage tail sheath subtilisin-like domain-containing protein, partial [Enhygromyxa sp.]|nr:phage tail sheath subtilisin-like domain-containing protein [Enhygromyxa sp.]